MISPRWLLLIGFAPVMMWLSGISISPITVALEPIDYSSGTRSATIDYMDKFGRNVDIDQTLEDIWDGSSTYAWATVAESLEIVSSAVTDDADSVGARTVEIEGLDSLYAVQLDTVTLNGTVAVGIPQPYIRNYRMRVLTAGSNEVNDGTLTLRVNNGGATRAQITISYGQTLMAIYTIPGDWSGYMEHWYFSVGKRTAVGTDAYLLVRPFGSGWQLKHTLSTLATGSSTVRHPFPIPLKFDEKTDIRICAATSANDADMSAGFALRLIKN